MNKIGVKEIKLGFLTIEKWLNRNAFKINFKRGFISFTEYAMAFVLALSKYKNFEIYLLYGGSRFSLKFECPLKDIHSICFFNLELPKLFDLQLSLYDVRDKKTHKTRRKVAYWVLNTQNFKYYNSDVLNNLFQRTFDIALFPLLWYIKFTFGLDEFNWLQFVFNIEKDNSNTLVFEIKLNLLCFFVQFTIGENTVIRDVNTFFYKDFHTLKTFGADIYKTDIYGDNIITGEIINKNLPFLYALLEWEHFDFERFDTDYILRIGAEKWIYRKKIFEFLIKHINYIRDWEYIEKFKEDLVPYAYWQLCQMRNNPIPQIREQAKKSVKEKFKSWLKEHFRFSICNKYGFDLFFFLKGIGYNYLDFNLRKLDKFNVESNFTLNFSRDFGIKNYLITDFKDWKQLSIRIARNNVYSLQIVSNILGISQDFRIKTIYDEVMYNFKEQRLMTTEEIISQDCLNKNIDTSEPKERRKKYKEFYFSKFIKIYNNNYLNKPYGRTIEFALPFNHYIKLTFNRQHYYNYKNETNIEFACNFDKGNAWCDKNRYIRLKLSAFKHYFKIVLGENTINRHSVIHSDKSLAKITTKNFDEKILNRLFETEIKPHQTWIFKKIVNKGIDLSKLNFDNLIYQLAFKHNYHKATLDYMLQVARDNNARLYFLDENETKSNTDIIKSLREELLSDFTDEVLEQLVKYVKKQEDISPKLTH